MLQSLENLQAYIDSLGAWGGPLAFLLVSTASVMFPVVPGGLLVVAGPVLFGPVEGGPSSTTSPSAAARC